MFFQTVLVSSDKLRWYVDGTQLTEEFKGKLYYDHQQWIRNRVHYEKYMGEVEEKLDVFENFSQKAKLYDEASALFSNCTCCNAKIFIHFW